MIKPLFPSDQDISIHALRVEGDVGYVQSFFDAIYFYPRPPGGGRPRNRGNAHGVHRISIHALRVEGDPLRVKLRRGGRISIHALRVEGDSTGFCYLSKSPETISIHALRVEGDHGTD